MDPLTVLPPELMLNIFELLPPPNRARLQEVSHAWRSFLQVSALWRSVDLDMEDSAQDASNLLVLLRAPTVRTVTLRADVLNKFSRALRSGVQVRPEWCLGMRYDVKASFSPASSFGCLCRWPKTSVRGPLLGRWADFTLRPAPFAGLPTRQGAGRRKNVE